MMWDLPVSVEIDGECYPIRNECDYRVVLDAIYAIRDESLSESYRIKSALFIFYGNSEDNTVDDVLNKIKNVQAAIIEMFRIINLGENVNASDEIKPKIMDWKQDFQLLAPPISRVLGYSVRDAKNYTHYYDFVGAYQEIGECVFSTIVSIRSKRAKGKKLEKHEEEFYKENRNIIDLPQKLTDEEQEFLASDW